jgi:hypothetical protein
MNVAHPRPVARLTRRTLLMRAGAATFVAAGWAPAARASTPARRAGDEAFIEATVVDLQRQMASGRLTSRALTQAYLERIARLNPLLHAVIETNPQAIASAARVTCVAPCMACRSCSRTTSTPPTRCRPPPARWPLNARAWRAMRLW